MYTAEIIVILATLSVLYVGVTIYTSLRERNYRAALDLAKGILVGLFFYAVLIAMVSLLRKQILIEDSFIMNSYLFIALAGNLILFLKKKYFEGMGMLISLPLGAVILFVSILVIGVMAGL